MDIKFFRYGVRGNRMEKPPTPLYGVEYNPGFLLHSDSPEYMKYRGTQGDLERVVDDAIKCLGIARTGSFRLLLDPSLDGDASEIERKFKAYAEETGAKIECVNQSS